MDITLYIFTTTEGLDTLYPINSALCEYYEGLCYGKTNPYLVQFVLIFWNLLRPEILVWLWQLLPRFTVEQLKVIGNKKKIMLTDTSRAKDCAYCMGESDKDRPLPPLSSNNDKPSESWKNSVAGGAFVICSLLDAYFRAS